MMIAEGGGQLGDLVGGGLVMDLVVFYHHHHYYWCRHYSCYFHTKRKSLFYGLSVSIEAKNNSVLN